MTSDCDDSGSDSSEAETHEEEASGASASALRRSVSGLADFSASMRQLDAAIKMQMPDISAIQKFAADAAAVRQLMAGPEAAQALFAEARTVQQQMRLLASQIVAPPVSQLTAELERQKEIVRQIANSATFKLPDFRRWADAYTKCLPENLRDVHDLGDVYGIALNEGIPFSWIPRLSIVTALIEADSPQNRLRILSEHQADVLEDCDAVLTSMSSERATQCRAAVEALCHGSHGPAQSHASNIVDSVVLALGGNGAREDAVDLARRDLDDFSFRVAAEMLTLRPLACAFVQWWPNSGDPLPPHFARHVTSHAVGHVGVFDPQFALIAVMLATSLVAQFDRDLP